MLREAISFPRSGDDWLPTILIGGILSILSPLILPGLVIQGYLVRVLRESGREERALPSFTEWGTLLVDGVKLIVINFVYSILIFIPYGVFVTSIIGMGAVAGGDVPSTLSTVALVSLLVLVLVSLLVAYVVPAAMANFALEDSLGAAFHLSTIRRGAFTREYAVGWLLAILVGVVGGLVGLALSLLVVGIFVLFYVQVAMWFLLGRGYARGLERTGWPPDSEFEPAM